MSAAVPCFRPDGTLMDLMAVQPDEVDFAEMANCLSKIPRFNGRYRVPGYSVAQHCVMGADALYSECGDALLAGYFLLHDGHEYLSGDVTRPMVAAIEMELASSGNFAIAGEGSRSPLRDAINRIKHRFDQAIFAAAGLRPVESMPAYHRQVRAMDERMLVAECRFLYGAKSRIDFAQNDLPAPRITGSLKPWGPAKAEEAFCDRLERYLGIVVRMGL